MKNLIITSVRKFIIFSSLISLAILPLMVIDAAVIFVFKNWGWIH